MIPNAAFELRIWACRHAPLGSPFHHRDGPQLGDFTGKPGVVNDVYHLANILVRIRLLFGQTGTGLAFHQNPFPFQLLEQLLGRRLALSLGTALGSPGAMTARAERLFHGLFGSDEHIRTGPHTAGNQHGLPQLAQFRR